MSTVSYPVWSRQPQNITRLDYNNPINEGLIHTFSGISTLDSTTGRSIALSGTGKLGATDRGVALIGSDSSATGSLTVNLSPYSGITWTGLINWPSTIGTDDFVFEYTSNLNTNAGGFAFDAKPVAGFIELAGRPTLSTYASTRYPAISAGWHMVTAHINNAASVKEENFSLTVDGNIITPSSYPQSGVFNAAFPNSILYILSRNNASLFLNAKIGMFLLHGRLLSNSEVVSLHNNPWQIFRSQRRITYFDLGGSPPVSGWKPYWCRGSTSIITSI